MQTIIINTPGPIGPTGPSGSQGPVGPSIPFNEISSNTWQTTSSIQIDGNLIVNEGITGSLLGSSSYALTASYALEVANMDTSSLVNTSSFNNFTSSYYQDSASFDNRINNINIDTSFLVTTSSFNNFTSSYYQDSASFESSINNLTQQTGSYATTSSNSFYGNQTLSGSLVVLGDVTIFGSSSLIHITASQLDVGTNTISVNVFEPPQRFGGLIVYDSGSLSHQATASLLWDSQNNHWIYQNASGSTYSGGGLISGPKNFGALGNETYPTLNRIVKGEGGDHITDSNISDDGSIVSINSNTQITGSTFISSSNKTQFQVGNDLLYISSSGDIGIRTTIPSASLQIKGIGSGSATTTLRVENTNNSSSLIITDDGVSTFRSISSSLAPVVIRNGTASDRANLLTFLDDNGSTNVQIRRTSTSGRGIELIIPTITSPIIQINNENITLNNGRLLISSAQNTGIVFGSSAASFIHRFTNNGNETFRFLAGRTNVGIANMTTVVFDANTDFNTPTNRLFDFRIPVQISSSISQSADIFKIIGNTNNTILTVNTSSLVTITGSLSIVSGSSGTTRLNVAETGRITVGQDNTVSTQVSSVITTNVTNGSIVLAPNGTGAIIANIPSATGGGARGDNAVDLQTVRTVNSQVASGLNSVIGGGKNNTASSNDCTVAGGQSNTASDGAATVAGGISCTASGNIATVGGGNGNLASGARSTIAGGESNQSTGNYTSISGGYRALSSLYGQRANAAGHFAARSDAQTSSLTFRRAITGTAITELFLDGASLKAILGLPSGATNARAWRAQIDLVAIVATAGTGATVTLNECFMGSYLVGIKRVGATTSLVGSVKVLDEVSDTNMVTSVVTIDADDTNEALRIQFTPPSTAVADTVIRVVATAYLTEVAR